MSDKFKGKRILQPKKDILSYLATEGIRIPEIYDTIGDAISSGKEILLRSEHPQDYEGSSDLFPNSFLSRFKHIENPEDITRTILNESPFETEQIRLHCSLLDISYDEFIEGLTHTAWEYIPGINRTIVADSAIKDKYHIITTHPDSYVIYEKGEKKELNEDHTKTMAIDEAESLIDLYENIQSLLDKDHCYIIETQTRKNKGTIEHFALQVHRGVDFKEAGFTLDKQPSRDYHKLYLVRGATSENGQSLKLTLSYPGRFRDQPEMIDEDASSDSSTHHIPGVFSEIMYRRRKLQMVPHAENSPFYKELRMHSQRSALFKPENSAVFDAREFYNLIGNNNIMHNKLEQVSIHYISDGRKGYVKFF